MLEISHLPLSFVLSFRKVRRKLSTQYVRTIEEEVALGIIAQHS